MFDILIRYNLLAIKRIIQGDFIFSLIDFKQHLLSTFSSPLLFLLIIDYLTSFDYSTFLSLSIEIVTH